MCVCLILIDIVILTFQSVCVLKGCLSVCLSVCLSILLCVSHAEGVMQMEVTARW